MKLTELMGSKKGVVYLQIADGTIKALKCAIPSGARTLFTHAFSTALSAGTSDVEVVSRLKEIFKKIEYNKEKVIVSLACHQATHRYIKVPAKAPKEIEQMISFQAPKFLPYASSELVTGYHVISVDKEGYSHVHLIIVPLEFSQRYCNFLKELGTKDFVVTLSSYGLAYLYEAFASMQKNPIMLVDADATQTELAIVCQKEVLLSRSFKPVLNQSMEMTLSEEIQKTNAAYAKETQHQPVSRVVILGQKNALNALSLSGYQVEQLMYLDKINAPKGFIESLDAAKGSFANLIGLAMNQVPESINLSPKAIKDSNRKLLLRQERIISLLLLIATIFVTAAASKQTLNNKYRYRDALNAQLRTIAIEAKPLEDLEKRLKYLHNLPRKKPTPLDVVYELHRIVPESIALSSVSYEESGPIVLHGQSRELSDVFALVSSLESSEVFKSFTTKVRYATKKKVQTGEIVEFEIGCSKEK